MTRKILLASYEVPGYGGASTASYRLLDFLRASGYPTSFVNLIDEQDAEFFRYVFGPSVGNPRSLENVHNCELAGRLYGPHPELTRLVDEIQPDVMIGAGFIAALLLARAAPSGPLVFLTTGCQQLKNAIMRKRVSSYLDVKKEIERGIRRPDITSPEERSAMDAASLVVVHSEMTRDLYGYYFPHHTGRIAPETLSFARWIHADALEHADLARPFEERDIDVLFVASDWRRPEKNGAFVQRIASLMKGRRVAIAGEIERPPRHATSHGLVASRRETFALMGRARVVVSPSSFDTAPGVLFEASALGCNVVASENCGNASLCEEGLLVREFTPRAFAGAAERALESKRQDNIESFLSTAAFDNFLETLDVL